MRCWFWTFNTDFQSVKTVEVTPVEEKGVGRSRKAPVEHPGETGLGEVGNRPSLRGYC